MALDLNFYKHDETEIPDLCIHLGLLNRLLDDGCVICSRSP